MQYPKQDGAMAQQMRWWLIAKFGHCDSQLVALSDHKSDCVRELLRLGRPKGLEIVEMPAGDEEGIPIGYNPIFNVPPPEVGYDLGVDAGPKTQ
jgi:hypothetical protein